jgi:hypothetical protein
MSNKNRSADAIARANNIIDRMFVETAEKNYIVARWAFFHRCNVDFFWLSAQAIEKYLKAILLYNGHPTIDFRHDLNKLTNTVLHLYPSTDIDQLTPPKPLERHFFWRKENLRSFIHRLNEMGDPNNRYMLYGYTLYGDDIYKLDQIIFQLHRHCRPLKQIDSQKLLKPNMPDSVIDWVEILKKTKNTHQIFGRLERLNKSKERQDRTIRSAFLKSNFAFAPTTARSLKYMAF